MWKRSLHGSSAAAAGAPQQKSKAPNYLLASAIALSPSLPVT